MSGFDTGNSQGIISRGKQFGPILKGFGPPSPQAGDLGDLYVDVGTWQLFAKREDDGLDPWGHYLFVVPMAYQNTLSFFGSTPPTNDLGNTGDFYLQWGGYPNYGLYPTIYGPKLWTGWPSSGVGSTVVIAPGTGGVVIQGGLLADGSSLADQQPSQLIAVGLLAEFTIPVPVTAADGDSVQQIGVATTGTVIPISPNALYTAEDEHSI